MSHTRALPFTKSDGSKILRCLVVSVLLTKSRSIIHRFFKNISVRISSSLTVRLHSCTETIIHRSDSLGIPMEKIAEIRAHQGYREGRGDASVTECQSDNRGNFGDELKTSLFPFSLPEAARQPFQLVPFAEFCEASFSDEEKETDLCDAVVEKLLEEDRSTVADETPIRLHSTWLSQECEVRAGPEYVIRKYTFFENGSFLLLRHHYAEESCSIATHAVLARGSIKLSSPSALVLGATEANVQLDTVNLIPLNRQVAHKFGRKLNASCGFETKYRPYIAQLVYERVVRFSDSNSAVYGPSSNSVQSLKKRRDMDCLDSLGIEFTELNLLRVQRKGTKVELLLAGNRRSIYSRRNRRPTWLQATPLLRADTTSGCPICPSVSRGTEYSPPLLHELPPLPAVIDGVWLSTRCESVEHGFWSRRIFHVYSGDKRWTARWDYYADSSCSSFLYAATAAGSYMQRDRRKRNARNIQMNRPKRVKDILEFPSSIESNAWHEESNIYRHIFRNGETSMARAFAAILRGNLKEEERTKSFNGDRSVLSLGLNHASFPSGTTELQLQVDQSTLIPADTLITVRCGTASKIAVGTNKRRTRGGKEVKGSSSWARSCVPWPIEAPSILTFRAKLGLDWSGGYTLLLGSGDDDLWEAPLRRCSETSPTNSYSFTRNHLGELFRELLHTDVFPSMSPVFSSASSVPSTTSLLFCSLILLILHYSSPPIYYFFSETSHRSIISVYESVRR